MARHTHTFVEQHTDMLCFGASRQQDEATLICCLQKFSDDQAMEAAGVVTEMGTNGQREVLAPPPIED